MIYVPRDCINLITRQHDQHELQNPSVCVKMIYLGYEISIACDSSHSTGDLSRCDIRVYKDDVDITDRVVQKTPLEGPVLPGTVENLTALIKCIEYDHWTLTA